MPFPSFFPDRRAALPGGRDGLPAAILARVFCLSLVLFLVAPGAILLPRSAAAEQFVVDDAATVGPGACQVEAWWGEAEAWVLPACQFIPRTEVTAGLSHLDAGLGGRGLHGVLEAKLLLRDSEGERWGWGVVLGGALPLEEGSAPTSAWAYLPLSLNLQAVPAVVHLNAGWGFEREYHLDHTHDHHGLAWGVRGDLEVAPRITLMGELFGLSGDGVEGQVGLRGELLPDRLALDVSWAHHFDAGEEGLGFQVGLAWTPAPIRRP
jgi:hypothetical protein